MLFVLSPAKTLDESPIEVKHYTEPSLLKDSKKLIQILKKRDESELMSLMKVSEKIASLNVKRFKNFKTPFSTENAKPAIYTFKGDVYLGLEAKDFNQNDLKFAQKKMRILSGLYGVLRPLDLMQSYRLEMGTRLKNGHGDNLYDFWGDKINDLLNKDIEENKEKVLINLASQEYFKAVKATKLNAQIINIHFKENRNGELKMITFNAKKARGSMGKQIIQLRLKKVDQLKDLDVLGYKYKEGLSTDKNLYFIKD